MSVILIFTCCCIKLSKSSPLPCSVTVWCSSPFCCSFLCCRALQQRSLSPPRKASASLWIFLLKSKRLSLKQNTWNNSGFQSQKWQDMWHYRKTNTLGKAETEYLLTYRLMAAFQVISLQTGKGLESSNFGNMRVLSDFFFLKGTITNGHVALISFSLALF